MDGDGNVAPDPTSPRRRRERSVLITAAAPLTYARWRQPTRRSRHRSAAHPRREPSHASSASQAAPATAGARSTGGSKQLDFVCELGPLRVCELDPERPNRTRTCRGDSSWTCRDDPSGARRVRLDVEVSLIRIVPIRTRNCRDDSSGAGRVRSNVERNRLVPKAAGSDPKVAGYGRAAVAALEFAYELGMCAAGA